MYDLSLNGTEYVLYASLKNEPGSRLLACQDPKKKVSDYQVWLFVGSHPNLVPLF